MVRYRFDGMEYEARAQDLENTNPAIAFMTCSPYSGKAANYRPKRRRTATNIRELYRQANLCSTRMRTVLMPLCIFSAATYSLNLIRPQNKPNAVNRQAFGLFRKFEKSRVYPVYFSGGIVYDNRRCSVLAKDRAQSGHGWRLAPPFCLPTTGVRSDPVWDRRR